MEWISSVSEGRGFWPGQCIPWRLFWRVWFCYYWLLDWPGLRRGYFIELGGPAFAAHLDHVLDLEHHVSHLPRVVVFIAKINVFALHGPLILRYHLYITKELIIFQIIPLIIKPPALCSFFIEVSYILYQNSAKDYKLSVRVMIVIPRVELSDF